MNIFVVETPHELINAIEAKRYFGNDPAKIYIHSFYEKKLFLDLLDRFNWSGQHFYYRDVPIDWSNPRESHWRQFSRRRRIEKIIYHAGAANFLFIDYVRYHMRHVANNIRHNKLILIDGGTDALRVAAMRFVPAAEEKDDRYGTGILRSARAYIKGKYFDWDTREIPSVTFFSSYDFKIRDSDDYVKNEYYCVKDKISSCSRSDEVYLLGQPLVEDGYLDAGVYSKYIDIILERFSREGLVYVPHPRESHERVLSIANRHGIRQRRFDYPIEMQILVAGQIPAGIVSFFSSAIENCRVMFGDIASVYSVYINQDDFSPGHEYVEDIYSHYRFNLCENFRLI